MTHENLVILAKEYARSAHRCSPVFSERGSAMLSEFPDVIGWTAADCIVYECKISKEDFRADLKKPHRQEKGLGNRRYYVMPHNLYKQIESEIPEGFGIVTDIRGKLEQIRFKSSKNFERNLKQEVYFLRSRIFEIQGYGV